MDSHKIIIKMRGWDDNACLGVRNTSSIGAWPNSLDRRPPWYCYISKLWVNTYIWNVVVCNSTISKISIPRLLAIKIGVVEIPKGQIDIMTHPKKTLNFWALLPKPFLSRCKPKQNPWLRSLVYWTSWTVLNAGIWTKILSCHNF